MTIDSSVRRGRAVLAASMSGFRESTPLNVHDKLSKKNGMDAVVLTWDAEKRIVLYFEGSETMQDWLQNLKLLQTDLALHDGVKVHHGFWLQLQPHLLDLERDVYALACRYAEYTLMICGYSLGAAVAQLAALHFCAKRDVEIVTFASPRVGNRAWASLFDSKISHYRVTNGRDCVPAVPALWYAHTGTEVHLMGGGYRTPKRESYIWEFVPCEHSKESYMDALARAFP